jgi:hypothetical protein
MTNAEKIEAVETALGDHVEPPQILWYNAGSTDNPTFPFRNNPDSVPRKLYCRYDPRSDFQTEGLCEKCAKLANIRLERKVNERSNKQP